MLSRAARRAGRKPPKNPMSSEKAKDQATIEGANAKENASSANDAKFSVEMLTN